MNYVRFLYSIICRTDDRYYGLYIIHGSTLRPRVKTAASNFHLLPMSMRYFFFINSMDFIE